MAKYDKYHPNYKRLYPGVELTPEVLDLLDKSDRKMEYAEVDLKTERFSQDLEQEYAVFFPSREDSYNRLMEEECAQFAVDELSPEALVVHADELCRLRLCLTLLSGCERKLIHALFFEGLSERELAKQTQTHYMTIHCRKVKILGKLRKLLEK